jgi:hypothetical protein
MNLDALNALVSGAIWRAEQLDALGLETAASAWLEVSRFEEELSKALPVSDPEGRIARRGAVRAAVKANLPARAKELVASYLAEKGVPKSLRGEFTEILEADSRLLAEEFPSAARHHNARDFQHLVAQLLERGPFCLAAA